MKWLFLVMIAIGAGVVCPRADAEFRAYPRSVTSAVSTADLVITGVIVHFTPDSKILARKLSVLQDAGTYSVHIHQVLMGKSPADLIVHLPEMRSGSYNDLPSPPGPGDLVLLVLRHTKGSLEPSDNTIPIIPLASTATATDAPAETAASTRAIRLVAMSLSDPKWRKADAAIIQMDQDEMLPAALAPYMNDSDPRVRGAILYGLASNQQVSVIPRIVRLENELQKNQEATGAIMGLSTFTIPEAIPYLNEALFSPVYFTRVQVIFSLDRLVNQSSIPYLLLAMRDPDPQQIIETSAWALLHQSIPALGIVYQDGSYFYNHREEAEKPVYQWWSDELSGKHLAKDDIGPSAQLPSTIVDLNKLLFSPYQSTRKAVSAQLVKLADKTSIPYLIIALQDPDNIVAFNAITTLGRLIPGLTMPGLPQDFADRHNDYAQPVYDWWRAELSGKHL